MVTNHFSLFSFHSPFGLKEKESKVIYNPYVFSSSEKKNKDKILMFLFLRKEK
jgi:hypothetical protein